MRAFFVVSAFFIGLISPATAQDVENFYRGKQVRIIVGFSSGGGYDQYGRLLARHISKHIPGVPNVVVQNMPGAASLKSLQYLDAGAPPDGTTIVTFNPGLILGSLTAPQKTPIDFRNFSWIGNISEDVRVCFTWHTRGMRDWKAFLARDNVVFGNTGVGTSAYLDNRMLLMLFGVKLKMVQGYPGSADKKIAIESGELDGDCGSWTSLPLEWLREKKIDIHVRFSSNIPADMPKDIPWASDFLDSEAKKQTFRLLVSGAEIGRPFLVSKAVPTDRVNALRTAFDATMKDPEFLADAEKQRLLIGPDNGAAVAKRIAEIYASPPEVIARARDIAGD
jgi:tripartite-type tricarboxylate transporter receptor subunit TctC